MNNLLDRISGARDVDNRPLEDMIVYLEARCDALSRRVHELERENAELRRNREAELENAG